MIWLAAVLVPALITGLTVLATTWVTNRRNRIQHAEQTTLIEEVREQVANEHPLNLRDEMDVMHAEVVAGLAKLDERTARIGGEVRLERELRREEDARAREAHARLAERVETVIARHHPEEA